MDRIQGGAMQFRIQGWVRSAVAFAMIAGCATVVEMMPPAAFAQTSTSGSINGLVVDTTGAVVPNATVTLKDESTGAIETLITNADGRFTAAFLKPDLFEITATAPGMQSAITTVQILTGQQTGVNVTVTPTASSQTVQVTANNAQLIDTQTANLVTTFTTQQFQNLPAPGGDITTIAYTVPGVVVGAGTQGFGAIVSDGLPGLSNLVVINGADYSVSLYNIAYSGSTNLTLGQQEIAQAAVVQNGYSVQYGRQAGIIETYSTKAGANRVHGLAQWNYNSAGLNANDFFNKLSTPVTPRSKAVSNQYAAQIGGPIKRDKLFFFADTEGLRFIEPSAGFVNLPSPAMQASILANPNLTAASKSLYSAMFAGANASPAYAKAIPVVTGDGSQQDSSGSFGCGLGPTMAGGSGNGLGGTPDYATGGTLGTSAAESCIDSAFVNTTALNREYLIAGRIDWNISPKHLIFFRVTDDQGSQPSFVSLINPVYNQISIQPSWTGQLNDTHTFSPNVTNQFIAAALYSSGVFKPANLQAALAASPTEFDEANNGGTNATPGVGQPTFFTASTTLGTPWIDFPGGTNTTQYQAVDNVSWLKGNHSIKLGFDFKRVVFTDVSLLTASYGGDYAFGSIADEAGGSLPGPSGGASFFQSFPALGNIHLAAYNVGIYGQDEWRATPNLVIDFGLRVDRNGNPVCNEGCYTHYLGGFPDLTATLDTPYNATLSAGHDAAFPSMEAAVIQPRAGFNWDTHGDGKTVLRGGIGLFSDNFPYLILEQTFLSFPNRYAAFVTSGTVANGPGSAQATAAGSASQVLNGFSQGATFNSISAALALEGITFAPPNYTTTPNTFHTARYMEYSLQLQRQITPTDAVILSYAGNHGYDLFMPNNHLNQNVGASLYGGYGNGTFDDLPAASPDGRFGEVSSFSNTSISNYNGFSAQYKHIDRRGLTANITYTYSHALDDISNGGNSQLPYNGNVSFSTQVTPGLPSTLMYSNADYDIRHNFVMDLVYLEPYHFDNKIVNFAAAGWTVGAKAYWRSGEPFSILNTNAENGLFNGTGGVTVLAQVLNNNFNHHCTSFSSPCFQNFGAFNGTGLTVDSSGATVPAYPTVPQGAPAVIQAVQTNFGNVPRNSVYGPHYSDVDATLLKDIFQKGSLHFQVGAQAYNLFNHVNFAQPNGNASNLSSLGQISGDINAPTSPYGSSQQPTVAGRVLVVQGRLLF